jgi:transmembrane sensor
MRDFDYLMQRYLDRKETEEELAELAKLIDSGRYEEAIKTKIAENLRTRLFQAEEPEEDKVQIEFEEVLHKILRSEEQRHKIVTMKPQPPIIRGWMVAATMAVICAVTGLWWSSHYERLPIAWLNNERIPATFTGKQYIKLPDGSSVLLNENSTLSYPTSYGEHSREVTLTGEGYFDVKSDQNLPFIVLTGNVKTKVLGTAFNVKADPSQEEISVTVERGLVQVGDDRKTYAQIRPDHKITVSTLSNDYTTVAVDADKELAWKDQYLIIDTITLEDAAKKIGEKYNVEVIIVNENLKKCVISATFMDGETLDHVIAVISGVSQASYTINDNTVKIEGGFCQ